MTPRFDDRTRSRTIRDAEESEENRGRKIEGFELSIGTMRVLRPAVDAKDNSFSLSLSLSLSLCFSLERGELENARYKFEESGNSAIRAARATGVTSFPPDYLANGEGGGSCWQRVSFSAAGRDHVAENIDPRSPPSRRAAFNKGITLAPFKISHF